MTADSIDLDDLEQTIDAKKVGEIVIDALQEILPHVRGSSTAEVMMAYAVMIKSTLIGMELSESEKSQAKALLDRLWDQVLVDRMISTTQGSSAIHLWLGCYCLCNKYLPKLNTEFGPVGFRALLGCFSTDALATLDFGVFSSLR